MKHPRILLADDHTPALGRIRTLLEPHYEIDETVADGLALVEAAVRLKPDLIITDISMPHLNGIDAARQIKSSLPEIALMFITMHSSSAYVRAAIEAGAAGYVLKTATNEELLDAVQSVLRGRIYIGPGLSIGRPQQF